MTQELKSSLFIRILIILATVMLSGCSSLKYGLFDMAINYECSKADLFKKTIEVDGRTIALLESERGENKPSIILLHGFTANKENWIRFAAYLTDAYHVVAIDLPGHGESFKNLDVRYDLDDQVRYLKEILNLLNIKKLHLAGNSMGGAISALYAATYPKQVASLFLIDPAGIHQYDCELNRLIKAGKNPLIVECVDDFDELMDLALEEKPFFPWPIKSVMAEKAVKNKAINEKIFSDLTGAHQYVFQEELKKIAASTLILWGTEDRLVHVDNAQVFNQLIPHSKKVFLDGIGHMPMLEAPEESSKIYLEFISSL